MFFSPTKMIQQEQEYKIWDGGILNKKNAKTTLNFSFFLLK